MASIDAAKLIEQMLTTAEGAARGHAGDLKNYLEQRAQIIADGSHKIVEDRLARKIDDEDVKFAFDQIKKSAETSLLAVKVTVKAAAQDAVNAALGIAAAAINKAIGIALL